MNEINKRYNLGMSIQDKYNSKTMRIILNDWINYYNQYLKINNNQGVKTMLNNIIKPSRIIKSYKIFNRLKSIINKVFENVGYFFIGYKVDIEQNQSDIVKAKAKIRILRSNQSQNTKGQLSNEYCIKALRDTQRHNIEDIQTLTQEVEALKDTLNKLRRDCAKQKKTYVDVHVQRVEDKIINLTNERAQDGTK